jgi:hypothetical protein
LKEVRRHLLLVFLEEFHGYAVVAWLLPFERVRMALPTSCKDRLLTRLAFVSPVTMPRTLCQHRPWASAVSGVLASDVYSRA